MRSLPTAGSFLPILGCIVSAIAQSPPAPAPKAPPSLYVTTVQDLRAAANVLEGDVFLDLPDSPDDLAAARFIEPQWDELRVRYAKEIATFAQAARLPVADFGVAKDPMNLGYDEVRVALLQLAELTAAQGWHHQRSREPGAAAHDAVTLLRHARHVAALPSSFAGHAAFAAERLAAALASEICRTESGLDDQARGRLRAELDEHLQRRCGRSQFVANVQGEVRWRLAATVRAAAAKGSMDAGKRAKPDPTDELIASRGSVIADRIEQIVADWLAPLQREGAVDLAVALAELDRQVAIAKKTAEPKKVREQLPKLSAKQAIEAVATMYALMMCPPIKDLLQAEARAAVELRDCRSQLGDAPPVK